MGLGVGLLLFGARLFWISRSERAAELEIYGIIGGDLLWVAGSAALIFGTSIFTQQGAWIAGIVALIVLVFADLQLWGAYRLRDGAV